ncbi:MAG: AAA family ATPase [Phormidesmis sp.]
MVEPLKLDHANACLWQGTAAISLTPKAMAVVEYLMAHAGSIATKEALLKNVWANENVSEYALTSIIRDLRRSLGDSTKHPRYIQTVHRRGYRWIGNVSVSAETLPTPDLLDAMPLLADTPQPPLIAKKNPLKACALPENLSTSAASSLPESMAREKQTQFFTGRAQELTALEHHLQFAAAGKRQVVFLTGEAGIGKTTLLETFLEHIESRKECSVTLGQCIEKYGSGEAYRPVLEALIRFFLTTKGERFISILAQYAPSWLVQMPSLLSSAQLLRLQQQSTVPKKRWLRELAEALEVITHRHLLVLVLEDLHWSDSVTIELLDMLARRQEAAKLLIIASYRDSEVNGSNHPLRQTKQELQLHNLCQEIALGYLTQQEVETYLINRFSKQFSSNFHSSNFHSSNSHSSNSYSYGPHSQPSDNSKERVSDVAAKIYQRTEGCPLFMVNVIDSLVEKCWNQPDEDYLNLPKLLLNIIPDNLKQLIDLQFNALDEDKQKILEAASVEGVEFLSVTVAASLKMESEQVELCIDDLVQLNHLVTIDDVEILPDGSLSTRYRFIHALYQEGLYQRIPQNRRVRLHRSIGARLETIYGDQADNIASQLALHFEQGMDYVKAIGYRQQSGENALRRSAHAAAIDHFHQGLALLTKVPCVAERETLELSIQSLLGSALMGFEGQAAPAVGKAYARARALCPETNPERFCITLGLWRHTFITGKLDRSLALAQQCFAIAQQTNRPLLHGNARYALAATLMYRGELAQALDHADAGLVAYQNLPKSSDGALRHSQDPRATLMAYRAWILFFMGYWDQAVSGMNALFELEIVRSHPQTSVTSLTYAGILYLYLREYDLAQQKLEKAVKQAQSWQMIQFVTIAQFLLDCTRHSAVSDCSSEHTVSLNGVSKALTLPTSHRLAAMQNNLTKRRAAGADLHATGYLNQLAAGYLSTHQAETSLDMLSQSQAFAEQSKERLFEADTARLMGEYFLLPGKHRSLEKAEALLQKSLTMAQRQKAMAFELRAATSLAQLWKEQGKVSEAKALLNPVYNKFTEGFEFADLKKTRHFLNR